MTEMRVAQQIQKAYRSHWIGEGAKLPELRRRSFLIPAYTTAQCPVFVKKKRRVLNEPTH